MENLLKIDNPSNGEKQEFGLIEVYPFLHYQNDQDINQRDLKRLFQLSLDSNLCVITIHVRSEEAQKEISSYLIGHGFDDINELDGDVIGLTATRSGRNEKAAKMRQYYTLGDDVKMMLTRSSLSIRVKFPTEELGHFKEVIKCLRYKKNYRNKWLNGKGEFIIK
jgi:hypothetical protein